jgi:hydrophobe/amphiphile efflux-3 (HAE3) family protein
MYRLLGQVVVRHRRLLLPIVLIVAATCVYFVPQLQFNFTPQQFFRTDSNLGEYREQFAEVFGREDNLVSIAISEGDVFAPETLSTLRNATLDIRDIESVRRAESITTFALPRSGDTPGSLSTDPLLPQKIQRDDAGGAIPVDAELAQKLRDLAMSEPLARGRLISEQGDAAVILAWLDDDIQQVSKLEEATREIESTLEAHPLPDELAYEVGGVPALRTDIVESLRTEQLTFIPITALAFLVVLIWLFRRASGVVLPLAVVLMAVAATVAVMVWTDSPINIVNNVLPIVVFIIGIADSIHLLSRHAEAYDRGASHLEGIREMVAETGFACLLTSTTTAVGFISLLYADTAILKNFGWQAATGVMLAHLFTMFFLPPALAYLRPIERRATPESPQSGADAPIERGIMALARRILDHPYKAIAGSLAFCALFGWFASWVVIDTTLLEVFHRDHPTYATTNMIEEKFGGFLPFEISLESDREDRFQDPEVYRAVHEFQQEAARESPVLSTQSIVDFHQSARAALLGDPEAREEMPDSPDQIRQLHLLVAGSPDDESGPNQFITRDFAHTRVLLRVSDVGARRQLELADDLRVKLREHFGQFDDIDYRITGDAYVASVALDSFIRDLLYSLLFASLVIFAMMTTVFRSLKIGLVSMIPNAAPLVITAGYMGLQGINLNSTTVIIFAIGLGIAVDDTIHVLARFGEEMRAEDNDVREALMATYFGAGRAIMLTSVLLLIGLGVLLMSDFIPTRRFGTLTSITIAAAILGDLILLPPLLLLVYGDDKDES